MSMADAVLDRLILEVTRKATGRAEAAELKCSVAENSLDRVQAILNAERDRLSKLNLEIDAFRKGERPIMDLYVAADEVFRAKTRAQTRKAKLALRAAMIRAEPHIDLIPF